VVPERGILDRRHHRGRGTYRIFAHRAVAMMPPMPLLAGFMESATSCPDRRKDGQNRCAAEDSCGSKTAAMLRHGHGGTFSDSGRGGCLSLAQCRRAINYYRPAAGARSHLSPASAASSRITASGDRTIFHVNIDRSDRIHAEILREIRTFQHAAARQAK
jgi:hypothetical protein